MTISNIEITNFKKYIYLVRNPKEYSKIDSIFPEMPHYNDYDNYDNFIKQFNCDNLFDLKTRNTGYITYNTRYSSVLFNPYINKYLIRCNKDLIVSTSNISLLGKNDIEFINSLNYYLSKKFLKVINVSFNINDYSHEFVSKINIIINNFENIIIDKFELVNVVFLSYYELANILIYYNNHEIDTEEEKQFVDFIKSLPYVKDLIEIPLETIN